MHNKTTLLSEGSSSNVFLTEDPNYVIKEYKSFYSIQSRMKEVQILELLKSNHIVKLITYTDNYLVLERLQTHDLFEVLQSQKLNTQIIKEICKTLIKIINYVHQNQVVHRDIKLENILIDKEGGLVLCDFGFAELLSNCTAKRTVGTLHYMPPELHQETLLGGHNSENINTQVLIKSDVFSLGVIIDFLLIYIYIQSLQSELYSILVNSGFYALQIHQTQCQLQVVEIDSIKKMVIVLGTRLKIVKIINRSNHTGLSGAITLARFNYQNYSRYYLQSSLSFRDQG